MTLQETIKNDLVVAMKSKKCRNNIIIKLF